MNFTVTISKWARKTKGVNKGTSSLLNSENNKCCLGFVCQQLGVPTKYLRDVGNPSDILDGRHSDKVKNNLANKIAILLNPKNWNNNTLTSKAVNINDNSDLTDETKMKKLQALFKKHGHTIKFK